VYYHCTILYPFPLFYMSVSWKAKAKFLTHFKLSSLISVLFFAVLTELFFLFSLCFHLKKKTKRENREQISLSAI